MRDLVSNRFNRARSRTGAGSEVKVLIKDFQSVGRKFGACIRHRKLDIPNCGEVGAVHRLKLLRRWFELVWIQLGSEASTTNHHLKTGIHASEGTETRGNRAISAEWRSIWHRGTQ